MVMPAVSENRIAFQPDEFHRSLEGQSFGPMADNFSLRLLLITFAGNVNRDQSRLIAYLIEENRTASVASFTATNDYA